MFEFLSVIFIIAGLSVLVIIHEAGHFFSAKWFGLLVEEFGFGLPPRAWGKKVGETLYSLNWLPFGGFVKIYGENRSEQSESYPNATNNTRKIIESDGFVSSGRDPDRSFSHQPAYKRALIIASGVLMNFLLGWVLISIVYMIGIPQALLVTDVRAGGLADLAGIQTGDQLTDFKLVPDFVKFLDKNKSQEISLNVERGEEKIIVKVTPRLSAPEGEGNLGVFLVESGLPKLGILESFWQGLKTAVQMSGTIFLGLADLIIGVFTDISILEKFIGPVGIVNVAIETAKLGITHFLQLLALISLNLAVFNVIPIPALDGGRLFLLLVEKIRRRPLDPKIEMAISGFGFAFLFFLIIAITVKDILTLF